MPVGPFELSPSRVAWLCVAGATLALGVAAAWRRRRTHRETVQVGTVTGLYIHPVKSCRRVSVDAAEVTEMGLRTGDLRDRSLYHRVVFNSVIFDLQSASQIAQDILLLEYQMSTVAGKRFWLVIKEDGHMVTARQEPRLVLVSVACEDGHLILNAPEMTELRIPVKLPEEKPVKNCRVFGLDIQGRDCGDDAARWFTSFLNSEPYRLVHFETQMTPRKCNNIKTPFRTNDEVPYSDCGPLLIISEASMEDLNTRVEKKVDMRNFRPSITVSGCSAYEEDTWDKIVIGDVEMKQVMACGRCILTTVDPDTGIIGRKEPLETLKRYRMCDPAQNHIYKSSPLFGSFYGVDKIGTIKIGDPVYKIIAY